MPLVAVTDRDRRETRDGDRPARGRDAATFCAGWPVGLNVMPPIEVSVNVLKPPLWNAFDTESTAVICSLPRPLSARTTRATWALEMLAVSPPRWRVVRRVVTFSARAVPPRSSSATKFRLDFPASLVQPSAW